MKISPIKTNQVLIVVLLSFLISCGGKDSDVKKGDVKKSQHENHANKQALVTNKAVAGRYDFNYVPPAAVTQKQSITVKTATGPVQVKNLGFPTQANNINPWISAAYPGNPVIRAHAWNVWGALTTLTPYKIQGAATTGSNYLPAFMTWYSSYEVYGVNSDANNSCTASQQPVVDANGIKRCRDVSLLAFNKLSLPESKYIIDKKYNDLSTLQARDKTPLDLPPFNDSGFNSNTNTNVSFSLKPVYYLLKNNAYNLLPYWGGMQAGTTSNKNAPVPTTWKQCVLIKVGKPTGTPPTVCNPGKKNANVSAPKGGWDKANLSQFLSVPLTQAMVDGLAYAQSPQTPIQASSIVSLGYTDDAAPAVGDVAVLVGMHVSVRETKEWLWQTMYWSPKGLSVPTNTDVPVFPPQTSSYVAGPNYPGSSYDNPYANSSNAPGKVPTWAQNYAMCTAYSPVYPVQPYVGGTNDGTYPQICFNPWLETGFDNMAGHFSNTGLNSNCMTCHGQASYQGAIAKPTETCNLPQGYGYYVNGYTSRDNSCLTKQNYAYDFSWHISNAYKAPSDTVEAHPAVIHQKPPTVAPSFSR
ncbi:MAG: hypothetical protein ACRBBR_02595 [Cellvibrionaceae bacterium]